jgi:hypothetical protein
MRVSKFASTFAIIYSFRKAEILSKHRVNRLWEIKRKIILNNANKKVIELLIFTHTTLIHHASKYNVGAS